MSKLLNRKNYDDVEKHDNKESLSPSCIFLCLFVLSHYIKPVTLGIGTGDHTARILAALACIFLFIEKILGNSSKEIKGVSLVTFFALLLCSVTWYTTTYCSIDMERSKDIFYGVFIKGLVVFVVIAYSINNLLKFKILLVVMLAGCFYVSYQFINEATWHSGRAFLSGSPIAGDPNAIAVLITYHIPFAAIFFLLSNHKITKILIVLLILELLIAFIQTKSRGGFLALGTVSLFTIYLTKGTTRKVKLIIMGGLAGAGFFARYGSLDYYYRMQEILYPEADVTGSALARSSAMMDTLKYTLSHAFSDYGPGNHSYYLFNLYNGDISNLNGSSDIFRGSYLAHNIFLQYGADNGYVPLSIYLIFIGAVLLLQGRTIKLLHQTRMVYKNNQTQFFAYALRLGLIGFLAGSFFLALAYKFFIFYLSGLSVALAKIASRDSRIAHKE